MNNVPSDHIDSAGRSFDVRVVEVGEYPYLHLGEVIAGGFTNPLEVVKAWMNSPGHKARILDEKYEHIGVGYTYDPSTAHWFYWAADLGTTSDDLQPLLEIERAGQLGGNFGQIDGQVRIKLHRTVCIHAAGKLTVGQR